MNFNQQVIDEFRANGGKVGGYFEDARLLLLTTTGARSGKPHTVPLVYFADGEGRTLVVGSAGGGPKHPAWYHNAVANPTVTVEDGVFTYQAEAVALPRAERDEAWSRIKETGEGWGGYEAATTRVIPVVALRQTVGGPPNARSFGEGLKLIHDAFRRELATLRREVATAGPTLHAQLRINCVTACQGLRFHHDSEEQGMFPALSERYPELAPVMARLHEEHERIAELVVELQAAVTRPEADTARVRADVDRLIADLESHLEYEEEQLIPLLDR
ncbi:nitroreductase/quinone reductase family protein [Actinosynnema sp. NPDC020468]|uniref:nitroreductase/quinone reductase family protein n=1 Tax=Actinosynnema sp. NPDC020468 TaxID=3154488 RepID=UPI0033EF7E58